MEIMADIPRSVKTPYPRTYGDFRGVDFANRSVSLLRSPDAKNIWKDYSDSEGKGIETRRGLTLQGDFGDAIYGIHFVKISGTLQCIIHSGAKLIKWTNYPTLPATTSELKASGMNTHESVSFVYDAKLYVLDGLNYLVYDGTTIVDVSTVAYIPTTSINRTPVGVGEAYEQVNILQPKRKNSFVSDGTSVNYALDTQNLDLVSVYTMTAIVNGVSKVETIDFTVDRTAGIVTFLTAPSLPATAGQDNIIITFSKTISTYADLIHKCTIIAEFDKRIFFTGNPTYPSKVYNSALSNPAYIGDISYSTLGTDINEIKTLIPGNNVLWGVKSSGGASIFYITPRLDSTFGKLYPNQQSNITMGCNSTGINFGDDIVFLTKQGLKSIINTDIQNENILGHRSSLVDNKMINETNYSSAKMMEFEGYLFILVNGKVFIADSRQKWANEDTASTEYEWYYFELPFTLTYMKEYDGKLFFGNASGNIYEYKGTTDNSTAIASYWTTPFDNFGSEGLLKTTNKKGGIASCTGDIVLSSSKDRATYETIGTYTGLTGRVVYKFKAKKFSELSLKFSSATAFKLYKASIEVYVGGYVK